MNIFDAIQLNRVHEFNDYIESNCDLNVQDDDQRTPLIISVIEGNLEFTQTILQKKVRINHQDDLGLTALHYACQNNHLDIVRLLLKYNTEINIKDIHGNNSLFKAVFNSRGNGEIIKLLIMNGADQHSKNNYDVSPLDLAKTIGNYEVSKYF
ncbi:ankyrin repeat domain-containing protein [Paenibacillus sp. BC26]|uniref:ankyrin repeat domain-containing protein n=1 Tax=Paenibacillus sp. BC26 TaxID=1881032 RepID=UPI0008F3CE32|nr:ankyrin repeat domain-containing protein [Paenibacillus sp. BC26]SFS73211.1 Ankyrin repeat-containing protein [Paenibacillus sp. BC26]